MTEDKDPDIINLVLQACKAEGLDPAIANEIEKKICEQYGGRTVYVTKKPRAQNQDKAKKIFNEGLSNKPTEQIIKENGISRATLYRYMKRG